MKRFVVLFVLITLSLGIAFGGYELLLSFDLDVNMAHFFLFWIMTYLILAFILFKAGKVKLQ
jgi:hypothetical protein